MEALRLLASKAAPMPEFIISVHNAAAIQQGSTVLVFATYKDYVNGTKRGLIILLQELQSWCVTVIIFNAAAVNTSVHM